MDKALKQRLVGAGVLIALAVIVLPMLLGGRSDGESLRVQKIELPPQPPELSFETRRYPIAAQGSDQQPKKDPSGGKEPVRPLPAPRSAAKPVAKPALSQVEKTVAAASTVEETTNDEPAPTPPPESAGRAIPQPEVLGDRGRYIVQVASFGSVANANKLSATLRSSGYTVTTDSVKSQVGTLHRVRVGPYDSEAQAKQIVIDLESKVDGVKPRVMDLQPGKSALITTPSDPLIRWVVQVGSFSRAGNAEKLVASLRLDGLSAYQETVRSGESNIYRVRIGPYLQREEALQLERELREKRSLDGVVMSAD